MISRGRGQNLTHAIAEDLGVAIVTGRYSITNPFPIEAALCEQYDASRSIVREAVKMLTAKGLLGARPRQGTWVQQEESWNILDPDVLRWTLERKFSFSLLSEFTQVRLAVEPKASACAATVGNAAQMAAISKAAEEMIEAERRDTDPLEPDIAFHVAILRASNNRFYLHLRDLIGTALRFSIRMTNRQKGARSVAEHKRVADAILAGDAVAAEESMRYLILDALDQIKRAEQASSPARSPRVPARAPIR